MYQYMIKCSVGNILNIFVLFSRTEVQSQEHEVYCTQTLQHNQMLHVLRNLDERNTLNLA